MDKPRVFQLGTKKEWQALPKGIRKRVDAGLTRLRRVRDAIAVSAKLPMPPIAVEPYGWHTGVGVVFGRAGPIAVDDNAKEFAAILPAFTLCAVMDDKTLREILCHEFAHCFWFITAVAATMIDSNSRLHMPDYDVNDADIDNEHLANPADWFGPNDVKDFMWSDDDSPQLEEASKLWEVSWLKMALPTKNVELDCRFEVETLAVDDRIMERARTLAACKSPTTG